MKENERYAIRFTDLHGVSREVMTDCSTLASAQIRADELPEWQYAEVVIYYFPTS
jgi:hypothetical protein